MEANATSALREDLMAQRTSLRRELEELGYGSEGLSYDPNFADSSQVTAERGETEALATTLTTFQPRSCRWSSDAGQPTASSSGWGATCTRAGATGAG